jgi:hypothetical protein
MPSTVLLITPCRAADDMFRLLVSQRFPLKFVALPVSGAGSVRPAQTVPRLGPAKSGEHMLAPQSPPARDPDALPSIGELHWPTTVS